MKRPQHTPSYHEYLQLGKILSAQRPPDFHAADPDSTRDLIHHEELLFIVMHQSMELWLKMILADMEMARDLIGRPGAEDSSVPEEDIPKVESCLERAALTLEHMTRQFTLIETMSPLNFLTFRDELIPSSGFQSWQFREVEVLAGLSEKERIDFEGKPYYAHMPAAWRAGLDRRRKEMTLREAVIAWLARTPVDEAFPGFAEAFLDAYAIYLGEQRDYQAANPNLAEKQKEALFARFDESLEDAREFLLADDDLTRRAHQAFVFIATYRDAPLLRWPWALVKRVLEFEEHFRLFRFRHARMVERMIGLRPGSGGSAGVAYLDATASNYRIFGDLLKAVSYLIDARRLPSPPHDDILKFRRQ